MTYIFQQVWMPISEIASNEIHQLCNRSDWGIIAETGWKNVDDNINRNTNLSWRLIINMLGISVKLQIKDILTKRNQS
jgi:hypothetical protein